jgi:hypothetical protein
MLHMRRTTGQSNVALYQFNLCINMMRELFSAHNCSHIEIKFYGCFLYVDDKNISSPAVGGLQSKLNTCVITCERIRLKFNPDKSSCIVFSRKKLRGISNMLLGNFCIH